MKDNTKKLAQLERQKNKTKSKNYFLLMCLIIVLVHIIDEITTNVGNMVQSSVVTEFFVINQGMTYAEGLASMTILSVVVLLFNLISPFYKSLADRFGRKIFIVINVLGMSLGLTLCYLSKGFPLYLVGMALMMFFIASDTQVIYIMENAPKEKRATVYAFTKCLGTIGLIVVPLARRVFLDQDATNWRPVFLIPAILGALVAIMAQLVLRESEPYLDQQIESLKNPEKSVKETDTQRPEKETKVGVFPAIKYCFTNNKDLRALTIIYILIGLANTALGSYYESIMHTGGMATADITKAEGVYPFVYALIILVGGMLSDKFGRKASSAFWGYLCAATFFLFVIGSNNGWNPYLIGALFGLYLGSYYTCQDYMWFMAGEKVPTEIRGSVVGALNLLKFGGIIVGMIILLTGMQFINVGIICGIIATPCLLLCASLVLTKVKDTKGVDLENI